MELRPGANIDRYTLDTKLGEGGQGEVWRATDRLQPGKPLALKLVPLAAAEPTQVERVRREARHLARLSHPTLPACHALFEDLHHGLLVVVLELVEGPTLTDAALRGDLDEPRKQAVLRHLISALAFLHGAGVVHRDVKPDNVILSPDFAAEPLRQGVVKLIDLGISVSRGNPSPLTVVGHVIGTPSFLAPEILDPHFFPGAEDTPAADIFAFGVLGWSLFHGSHPTGLPEGSTMASYALAYRQADQLPLWPPSGRGDPWEHLLRRCLAVRARERFGSAAEVLASLTGGDAGLQPSRPTRAEPIADRPSFSPVPQPSFPQGLPSALPATSPPAQPLDPRPSRPSGAWDQQRPSALPPTRIEPALPASALPAGPPLAGPPLAGPPLAGSLPAGALPVGAVTAERPAYIPTPSPATVLASPLVPRTAPDALPQPAATSLGAPLPEPLLGAPLPAVPLRPVPTGPVVPFAPLPAPLPEPPRPAQISALPPAAAPARPLPASPFAPSPLPPPAVRPTPAALAPRPSRPLAERRQPEALAPPAPKVSLWRYIVAFLLLLFGGAAAFVLTVVIFLLMHFGR